MEGKARKAHEAQAAPQLELGLLVGQAVEGLQHQDAEHQHRIIGWAPAAAAIRPRQRRTQHRAEDLEIHNGRETLQRVAGGREGSIPLIHIEEARLTCHCHCSR